MNTIKAAIIGPGNIARTHAKILREKGIEISLVQGTDVDRAVRFAEPYGISEVTTRLEDVLRSDVDVVHVCSPPAAHYPAIKRLLLQGKHVLCEKPLCLSADQARELYSLATGSGLVHAVGFNVRFYEAVQEAKRLIGHPEFGPTRLIHGSYLQSFHSLPAPTGWRYDPALAGPMRAVTEIGSHWFDLAQFISGQKITAVSAVFGNFSPKRQVRDGQMYESRFAVDLEVRSEDAALVQIRFGNGALGSVVLSEVSPGRTNALSIELTGTEHNLWWDSETANHLHIGSREEGVLTEKYPFTGGFEDTQRELFASFYKDVERGWPSEIPAYPTFLDGVQNVQICEAVFRSASSDGRWETVQ